MKEMIELLEPEQKQRITQFSELEMQPEELEYILTTMSDD